MHLRRVIVLSAICGTSIIACAQETPNFGVFTGSLDLHPVGDGIHMAVLNRYSYTDADGHTLTAEPGYKTDGASIPRALWTIVGSPFTGLYVGAAVVHDVGCDSHKYSWQVTHRIFYTAMRSLGVSDSYAKILYWGVRIGGPRWKQEQIPAGVGHGGRTVTTVLAPRVELTDEQAKQIARYVQDHERLETGAVTLNEIDQRTPEEGPLPENALPN